TSLAPSPFKCASTARITSSRMKKTPMLEIGSAGTQSRIGASRHRFYMGNRDNLRGCPLFPLSPIFAGLLHYLRASVSGFRPGECWLRWLGGVADVNLAFEKGAVFHHDAMCNHVPCEGPFTADMQALSSIDIANDLALDGDLASGDRGGNLPVTANRYPVAGKVDASFDPAFNVQRFRTR